VSFELTQKGENLVSLTITVSKEDFAKHVDAAYRKMVRRITIPGFRKGKAPRAIVEKNYGGPAVFYEDAFADCYPGAYGEAVREAGLRVVSPPEIDITTIDEAEGLVFTAEVWTYPSVTLGEYQGLKVEKPVALVTDEDVNAEIDRLRESRSRLVAVERAVELKDTVTFDFAGSVDGVLFDGGSAEGYELEIGSGRFIPGFEEQMVGLKIGEKADISVQFPDDYQAEELKGKPAVFAVTVHEVKARELPELTDEFVQDAAGAESVAEYVAQTREKMEKSAVERVDAQYENQLVDACTANATMEIPPPMIDSSVDRHMQDMERRVASMGIDLAGYLQYINKTEAEMREDYRPTGERMVKNQLVLEAIIEAEKIVPEEADIENEIVELAAAMGQDVESIRARITEQDRTYIAQDAAMKKVVGWLKEKNIP